MKKVDCKVSHQDRQKTNLVCRAQHDFVELGHVIGDHRRRHDDVAEQAVLSERNRRDRRRRSCSA